MSLSSGRLSGGTGPGTVARRRNSLSLINFAALMRRPSLAAFANVLSKTFARDDGGDGGDDGGDGEDSFKVSWNASPSLWKPMPSSKVEVKADFTSVGTAGTCTTSGYASDEERRSFGRTINAKRH